MYTREEQTSMKIPLLVAFLEFLAHTSRRASEHVRDYAISHHQSHRRLVVLGGINEVLSLDLIDHCQQSQREPALPLSLA